MKKTLFLIRLVCVVLISQSFLDTKVFNLSDWVVFGDIPTIDVYYKDGSDYITIPVQPIYNSMPTPTQITVTISGIPSDVWYIKLS